MTVTYRTAKRSRDEKVAGAFQPDPRFERLLRLTEVERDALLDKTPGLRMQLGFYRSARDAYARLQKEQS